MAHSSGCCKAKTRQSHLEGPVLHRHMDEEGEKQGVVCRRDRHERGLDFEQPLSQARTERTPACIFLTLNHTVRPHCHLNCRGKIIFNHSIPSYHQPINTIHSHNRHHIHHIPGGGTLVTLWDQCSACYIIMRLLLHLVNSTKKCHLFIICLYF